MEQPPEKPVSRPSMIPPTINTSKRVGTGAWDFQTSTNIYHAPSDVTLFSSSLPVLPHEKLTINHHERDRESVDDATPSFSYVLPDNEDELFAGIIDYDLSNLPSQLEESEEADLFDSLGGMELDGDAQESLSMGLTQVNLSDGVIGNGMMSVGISNGAGAVAGEHPYGEHPSRTLFVRNINSNVEDSELKSLFEQYGDIRALYTACKHRGFVMISYYDIRDARAAMRALQNKPLRRRKLDIHFSIPKDNPSEKDINQGTLVIFNLDPSVSNEDLRKIFGAYGEVKEIRETPHKRHHKFIEFYDVRAADAALRALNRSDIAGKRIKLEPSRPGGTRRNLLLQLNQEPELDDSRVFRHHAGSPIANSPPGNWLQQFNSPIEHSPIHGFSQSPGYRTLSPTTSSLPGLASLLQSQTSGSGKVALNPIGKDPMRGSHVNHIFGSSNSEQRTSIQQPHSLPEHRLDQYSSNMSFAASNSNGSGIETLSGPQFLWGSPSTHPEKPKATAWTNSPSGHSLTSNGHGHGHGHGLPYANRHHNSLFGSTQHHHHHVGSAPTGILPERHFGFFPESPDTSMMKPSAFTGGMNSGPSNGSYMNMINAGPRAAIHSGIAGNISEMGSPNFRMMSPRLSPLFLSHGPYPSLNLNSGETDRMRSRRVENPTNQTDSKKQFQLDLEKIANGEDSRTTLMIKNIPNKYTSKMLLAAIDEFHKGTYDFLYLPIDFKNKCNVGYAFINMLSPSHIIPFYEAFDGKKWEKFNSEKVASLAYARIQGRVALVAHFQNSSLMNEDKRCRPILFHSESTVAGEQIIQEHLPSIGMNIQLRTQSGSESGDSSYNTTKGGFEELPDNI
ncbi:hypothetical protein V2J09_010058 [Rumex salicifolius]